MRRHTIVLAATLTFGLLAASACGSDACTGPDCETSADTAPVSSTTTTPTDPDESFAPPTANLAAAQLQAVEIAGFDRPLAVVPRSGTDSLYVVEQGGKIELLEATKEYNTNGTFKRTTYKADRTVADLSDSTEADGEQGLLGMTFSSDGRRMFVNFTDNDGDTNVEELPFDNEKAATSDRRRLLLIDQPYPNHNGGNVVFGPDGFLYVGMGDGGAAGDPEGNAQDPNTLLGAILRIDPETPSGETPYGIPQGNPFAAGGGAPEVWLTGVRNPWRFSFDSANGDLWIADVGQDKVEEITWIPSTGTTAGAQANLGWPLMEGNDRYSGDGPPTEGYVAPIHTYTHEDTGGCSIVGGYVYRGTAIPALVGAYIYADTCVGEIRALVVQGPQVLTDEPLGAVVPGIVSFGQDNQGELWAASAEGGVYLLTSAG